MVDSRLSKIFIPHQCASILMKMPKPISKHEALMHMTHDGHSQMDITKDNEKRIQCPIYWDNATSDIIFNNYLCSCGKLFIFIAKLQEGDIMIPNPLGICPCDVCKYFKMGCTYRR